MIPWRSVEINSRKESQKLRELFPLGKLQTPAHNLGVLSPANEIFSPLEKIKNKKERDIIFLFLVMLHTLHGTMMTHFIWQTAYLFYIWYIIHICPPTKMPGAFFFLFKLFSSLREQRKTMYIANVGIFLFFFLMYIACLVFNSNYWSENHG